MTDKNQPHQHDRDLPTAGRKPPPVDKGPGGETTRLTPSGPGEATARLTPPAAEEPTTRLGEVSPAPSAASADHLPADPDEETTRLEPVGPGEAAGAPAQPPDPAGPGESTTRLTPRPAPAATDQAAAGSDPEGPTRRLSAEDLVASREPDPSRPDPSRPDAPERVTPAYSRGPSHPETLPAGSSPLESRTERSAEAQPLLDEDSSAEPASDAEPAVNAEPAADARNDGATPPDKEGTPAAAARRRLSSAGALIWLLLALFGFTLVVQLRSNDGDQGLATARQEDLVRILSDLEARDARLQSEINALENTQRQLTSGVAGRQAALAEAEQRADQLGLLAGTMPGRGPGLVITLDKIKASAVLNTVQELRGAGGEVMQIGGSAGGAVRIVASSYFVDAEGGGIIVDGERLTGPYTLLVIGAAQTMQTALQIPGGVVASVNSAGGSVTLEQQATVEVTAVRKATSLQYARPAS
ncbi:DUF881 domain-containing protein [Paractinoplanes rishiriensis]|uniref:DUF881 domain-containing protein n=1 Tax=Paractinoplanes rishiriensis TaxID=1050105 RepID=A0A919MXP5_9ACTN|nr:DUF881 domain-containing protein [Actinoplanes rishiriensis]GIE98829.1 hypothetical protein Ari01nite_62940 [Actinoplanes rishiriensis]